MNSVYSVKYFHHKPQFTKGNNMKKDLYKSASRVQESKINRFYRMNEDVILFITSISIPIIGIIILIKTII